MQILYFVLFLLAVVCFAVATRVPNVGRRNPVNLVALGLALAFAVFCLQSLQKL